MNGDQSAGWGLSIVEHRYPSQLMVYWCWLTWFSDGEMMVSDGQLMVKVAHNCQGQQLTTIDVWSGCQPKMLLADVTDNWNNVHWKFNQHLELNVHWKSGCQPKNRFVVVVWSSLDPVLPLVWQSIWCSFGMRARVSLGRWTPQEMLINQVIFLDT